MSLYINKTEHRRHTKQERKELIKQLLVSKIDNMCSRLDNALLILKLPKH